MLRNSHKPYALLPVQSLTALHDPSDGLGIHNDTKDITYHLASSQESP
jgi:hypothetical protein